MRISLDIDKLLEQGKIDRIEYKKLKDFALNDALGWPINVTISFGIAAVVLAVFSILPGGTGTVLMMGLLLGSGGSYIHYKIGNSMELLATILISMGTLVTSYGILQLTKMSLFGHLFVLLLCGLGGIVSKRKPLLVIATLELSQTVGVCLSYWHASYGLTIRQPFLTVVLFNLVGWHAYFLALRLNWEYQPLALTVARTSFFLVNVGFWVGSLWGDDLQYLNLAPKRTDQDYSELYCWEVGCGRLLPRWFFALAWAAALAMIAAWGTINHSAFVLNAACTFASIHFYTQYFERFHADPLSLLGAGVVALGGCITLAHWNSHLDPTKNSIVI